MAVNNLISVDPNLRSVLLKALKCNLTSTANTGHNEIQESNFKSCTSKVMPLCDCDVGLTLQFILALIISLLICK